MCSLVFLFRVSLSEFLVHLEEIFVLLSSLDLLGSSLVDPEPTDSKRFLSLVVDDSGHVCLLSSVASVQLGWCTNGSSTPHSNPPTGT